MSWRRRYTPCVAIDVGVTTHGVGRTEAEARADAARCLPTTDTQTPADGPKKPLMTRR